MVVGLAVAGGREILRFAVAGGGALAGYEVRYGEFTMGHGILVLSGLSVDRGAVPLVRAKQVRVEYSLRDLLPGSRHRFGILALDVTGVRVTITRFRDGTFDLGVPGGAGAQA